jgi:hypothetical protein
MRACPLLALIPFVAACTTATAAAPPPHRTRTDPAVLAAFARDTAVALGLTVPGARDRLELHFEQSSPSPSGTTIIRIQDPDHRTGLRLVISDDAIHGPRAVAAWPL